MLPELTYKPDGASTLGEMDESAVQAEAELATLPAEAVATIATWWKNHYMKAGHKRLGRVLVKQAPKA